MWTLTPGFADTPDTPLFCGHSEALRWRNLQFSIYLEIRGWRSCSCLLGDLKCRCWLPYSPNPCKHCFPKQRGLSLEDARDSCLASGSDFRWHSSSSPTHPLKPLPYPSPLCCFLSLSFPCSSSPSSCTQTMCLQMSRSYHGPRSQHDAKIHAVYLPGVAWDLRPAWSHLSPTLGQGTGDCHDP